MLSRPLDDEIGVGRAGRPELGADSGVAGLQRAVGQAQATLNLACEMLLAGEPREDAEAYHVSVDLPGIDPQNIEVTADNGLLSISGQRKEVHEDKELKRSERVFGAFRREFSLPDNADLDRVEANSKNGVLEITVPKAARPEPKRIEVR